MGNLTLEKAGFVQDKILIQGLTELEVSFTSITELKWNSEEKRLQKNI